MNQLLESIDLLSEPRVINAYWGLKGVSEWPHGSVQVEIREDSDGLYELRACPKCGAMWTWHTKHGERDYPYELCRVPDPIPGSLADVAFAMRDAAMSIERKLETWDYNVRLVMDTDGVDCTDDLRLSQPKHWIVAAVLAWEAKK